MKIAGPINEYMRGANAHEFVAEITHFKDIPEFGSDEDFVVIGITDGAGNVYTSVCVVEGQKTKGIGHTGKFKVGHREDGFITVTHYRGK